MRIKAFIEAEWGARAVREQNTYVAGRLAAAVERQHAVFRRAGRRGAVNHNIVSAFLTIFNANVDADRRPGPRLTVFQSRQRNSAHTDADDPAVAHPFELAGGVHDLADEIQLALCRECRAGGQSGKDRRQTQRDYFHFLSFSIARKAGARAVILMSLIYARYVFLFINLTD